MSGGDKSLEVERGLNTGTRNNLGISRSAIYWQDLNEGMPINFLEQSILGRVLDLVYTELFLCMREIALGNAGPGLQSLDIDQHRMAAQKWHRLHWV